MQFSVHPRADGGSRSVYIDCEGRLFVVCSGLIRVCGYLGVLYTKGFVLWRPYLICLRTVDLPFETGIGSRMCVGEADDNLARPTSCIVDVLGPLTIRHCAFVGILRWWCTIYLRLSSPRTRPPAARAAYTMIVKRSRRYVVFVHHHQTTPKEAQYLTIKGSDTQTTQEVGRTTAVSPAAPTHMYESRLVLPQTLVTYLNLVAYPLFDEMVEGHCVRYE